LVATEDYDLFDNGILNLSLKNGSLEKQNSNLLLINFFTDMNYTDK
jgi:hypothetical protein